MLNLESEVNRAWTGRGIGLSTIQVWSRKATNQEAPSQHHPLEWYRWWQTYWEYETNFLWPKIVKIRFWPCCKVSTSLDSSPWSQNINFLLRCFYTVFVETPYEHKISLEQKELYATNDNLYEQGTRSIGWRTVSTPAAKITLEEKTR